MVRMRVPPRLTFIGGVVVFLMDLSIRALDYFHRLTYLEKELPSFYIWLVGPTVMFGLVILGVAIMIAGWIEMRRERRSEPPGTGITGTRRPQSEEGNPHTIQQETSGPHSPATTIRDVGPGATVTVGNLPAPPSTLIRRHQPNPRLVARSVIERVCEFPTVDYNRSFGGFPTMELDCILLPIRNSVGSSADEARNVIAHLDFDSDTHSSVHIDEGWWAEDENETGSSSFCIGREETKYLVVAFKHNSVWFAVSKVWEHSRGRHMPQHPTPLSTGRWRVTVEITAEYVRETFYFDWTIQEDGNSTWSSPVTTRPSAWPK